MVRDTVIFGILVLFLSCKSSNNAIQKDEGKDSGNSVDFAIAFGSCNRTDLENPLWNDISAMKPDLWIWGGDNIYADTDDMQLLEAMYARQNENKDYKALKANTSIIGTWDDHDYGLNDGGVEFKAKKESQQKFLDFMGIPEDSPRRVQEGIYHAHDYATSKGTVKVLVLDTRYFRTAITPDTDTEKRLKPNAYGQGTILGEVQWKWLTKELNTSSSDFNIILSSIQVLSNEHGFECWGNFPHEVDHLKKVIADSQAKGIIVLSGDRHISEFSKTAVAGLQYPLIDFTSSGLTHAYRAFGGEPNPYRVGQVVATESFGVLELDFKKRKVVFKIVADSGTVLQRLEQTY